MKKKIFIYVLCIFLIFIIGAAAIFDFNSNKKSKVKTLEKVKMAEVAHTIFYAPMYVAIEKGYFKDYGIDIDLILANGADKVSAALLSGDADIGFSGSEVTIYVYNGGEKDYLKTFSQLTQKDGSFIVSRKKIDNFKIEDLIGKDVIGGRSGGMPEMTFEYVLKQNSINPRSDVNIDTSIAFPAMGGAFIGGQGDFVTFTSFSARSSYIKENKKLIENFDKAIQKGLDYVHNHTDLEVAKVILKQFPDTSLNDIESAVKRYRQIDAWPKTTSFSKESFDHLQDIMIDYGEIKEKVSYDKLMYKIKKK